VCFVMLLLEIVAWCENDNRTLPCDDLFATGDEMLWGRECCLE
jgi:hypothetical protein